MLNYTATMLRLLLVVCSCSCLYFLVKAGTETFALQKIIWQNGFSDALFQARQSTLLVLLSGVAFLVVRYLQNVLTLWVIQAELDKVKLDATNK